MRFNVLKFVGKESKRYANLPDSFIKRKMEIIYYKTPPYPNFLRSVRQQKNFYFEMERPWTTKFKQNNLMNNTKTPAVEPLTEWSYFRGDRVEILVGPDKGKQGYVKTIYQERNWVTVEGLNTVVKVQGKEKNFPGVAITESHPLLVTDDIQHVDPSDLKPTKVKWAYNEEGKRIRISVRTGKEIPLSPAVMETIDYKSIASYAEGAKDTKKEDVQKVTFEPSLKTFEMDIMDKMGIEETRTQKPTYWY